MQATAKGRGLQASRAGAGRPQQAAASAQHSICSDWQLVLDSQLSGCAAGGTAEAQNHEWGDAGRVAAAADAGGVCCGELLVMFLIITTAFLIVNTVAFSQLHDQCEFVAHWCVALLSAACLLVTRTTHHQHRRLRRLWAVTAHDLPSTDFDRLVVPDVPRHGLGLAVLHRLLPDAGRCGGVLRHESFHRRAEAAV